MQVAALEKRNLICHYRHHPRPFTIGAFTLAWRPMKLVSAQSRAQVFRRWWLFRFVWQSLSEVRCLHTYRTLKTGSSLVV